MIADDGAHGPTHRVARMNLRRVAWGVFVVAVTAVLGYAGWLRLAAPIPRATIALAHDGERFGLSEAERRRIFQSIVRGEPADRAAVATRQESANSNRDTAFHLLEARRIERVASELAIPLWQAAYILDEGIHSCWPPPPGVELRADDGPMAHPSTPLEARALLCGAT